MSEGWKLRLEGWAAQIKTLDPYLIALLLVMLQLLMWRVASPQVGLIFDEAYYVQDARVIAGLPVNPDKLPGNWFSGGDPNSEHPPLAKLIMALGTWLACENAMGWRFPSICLGLISLVCVYGIVRSLGGDRWQARLAAAILALDNLFFVHSRIATLDIYLVSFGLIGTWLYLRKKPELAGLALGCATLCKINGLLWVAALGLYEVLRFLLPGTRGHRFPFRALFALVGFWAAFTFFTLGALDNYWTQFNTPGEHVKHIFSFHNTLVRQPGEVPQGAESTPLMWWMNEKAFDYFALTTNANGVVDHPVVFLGKMSPYVIAAAPLALLFCAVLGWGGDLLALLAFCLFFGNYVPILLTWIKTRRICYLYYMLPSLPSFAIAIAHCLQRCPPWMRAAFLLAVLASFGALFPFKWAT